MYHTVHHSIGLDSIILNYIPLNCNKLHFLFAITDNVFNWIAFKTHVSQSSVLFDLFEQHGLSPGTPLSVISGAAPVEPVEASPNAGRETSQIHRFWWFSQT